MPESSPLPAALPATPPPASAGGQTSDRVRLVRNALPPLILLVVVVVEALILQLRDQTMEIWAHLLFYGLLGPAVTFFSVEWIAEGTRARERAEQELRVLYGQLSASHERLRAVQELMRDLTDAPDMGAVVEVAARGAVRVTGATHATLSVPGGLSGTARGQTLLASPGAELHPLTVSIPGGGALALHFELPPSPETEALAHALAAEVANGVEAARQRTLDLMTLYSVDQSIRAERNMRRLLSRVTRIMAERLGTEARAVYLSDQDGMLRLEYAQDRRGESGGGNPAPDFAQRVSNAGTPLLAEGAEAAEVFPEARRVLGLPMRDEDGLVGVLMLGDSQTQPFDEARVPLLALMAGQATLAVRNARAHVYSEELAISDERARIAREIHDSVAQSLAFTALKLDIVTRQMHKDPVQAEAEVRAASALLREQIREVRRSIFALRPIDLERYGLLETVRRYVADFGEQNNIKATLSVTGDVHLSPSDEAVVFRLLQESLNNVAKHAQASEVKVSLHGGVHLTLRVQDNGAGFNPEQISGRVSSAGGLGLLQMRERVEARGGNYRVLSSPGHGTVVEAEMPQA
ncbi:GAF domain-containing sensor histidine kinase [Deinococcus deserti]|uniref:Oxygen sensor histidine kinase NreB n=1 Tax=Deinococcus deserti (strain DSM 17065 / CIP 109153 / LMG 22923 / VCD115) TaxID=546414 RepID=C1CWZ6_DEIDV|nr:GAF domain-containing sensor histidine kinase [Deinococcus deserti]ACO46713.1 putative histidine kinase, classic, precursor; putative membrane protein [Deinococcus deserti VCD115]